MIALVVAMAVTSVPLTEEAAAKRIYAHLTIRDPQSGVAEARRAIQLFPESRNVQQAFIRALCEAGLEVEAIEEWQKISDQYQDAKENRQLLETLAWGVLNKGEESQQMNIRLTSLLGAAFTRDVRALPLLLRELKGSNALLRSIAAHLAATYGDAPLQDELLRLLHEEKVWYVRLEVLKAIGQLKIQQARPKLKEIVGNPKTLLEEKGEAIVALVNMYDAIDAQELKNLVRSNRAGLRQLACEVVAHLDLKEQVSLIFPLLQDSSPDVRIAALCAVGVLNSNPPQAAVLLDDPHPEVAITAAWWAMLCDRKEGAEGLKKWMEEKNPKLRRLASAALAVTGKRGTSLAYEMMRKSKDPYVQANLAIALIGQRVYSEAACDTLYAVFTNEQEEKWMWDTEVSPLFRSLAPSRVKHIDQIPHYPLVVDQMVRLDILGILSLMRYPQALTAVKSFLQNQTWGTAGAAAATLLEEGDDQALVLVRELLNDPDEKIRVQAALILALLGGEPSAAEVLQAAYPQVDREMKMHILEAIAAIGDAKSVPFLLSVLKEPFQVLRVVAASALIQCLYH
jgi:HEAT repeat protein